MYTHIEYKFLCFKLLKKLLCNVMLPVEGVASFDVSFVGAFDSGVATEKDTLVGNPLVVVFLFGGDVAVASLSG